MRHLIAAILFILSANFSIAQSKLLDLAELENQPIYFNSPVMIEKKGFINIRKALHKDSVLRLIIEDEFIDTTQLKLSQFANLQELHLIGYYDGILDDISKLTNLQILDLGEAYISEYYAQRYKPQLPESFWNLTNLKVLCLGDNRCLHLSEKIAKFEKLEFLCLNSFNIGGNFPLPLALFKLKKLSTLIISKRLSISTEINLLKKNRPDIQIYTSFMSIATLFFNEGYNSNYLHYLTSECLSNIESFWSDIDYKPGRKVKMKGKYVNGLPDGKWRIYNNKGKLTQTRHYKNGLATGKWKLKEGGKMIRYYENDLPVKVWKDNRPIGTIRNLRMEFSPDGSFILTYKRIFKKPVIYKSRIGNFMASREP